MDTSHENHETSENNYHEHTGPWSKGTEQVSCTAQSQSSSSAQMDKQLKNMSPDNLTNFKLVVSLHLPNGIIYGYISVFEQYIQESSESTKQVKSDLATSSNHSLWRWKAT